MQNNSAPEKKLVWYDCDPGIDDALALMLIRQAPNIQLIGISTVHGNTVVENCTRNALGLLKMYAFENVPVFQGQAAPLFRSPAP